VGAFARLGPLQRAILVTSLAAFLAACGSSVPSAAPTRIAPAPTPTRPPASAPLPSAATAPLVLTLETRDCAAGTCDQIVNVFADGSAEQVVPGTETLPPVPVALVTRLVDLMEATKFVELKQHRRPNGCDASDKGREVVLTFHTSKRDQNLSTCVFTLDHKHPLMVAADAVVAAIDAP
jgi:hypothetical protein